MSALTLESLAGQINAEHQAAEQSALSALEHARRAGELLIQAKESVPHGQWLQWLEANVYIGPRQCQKYMRLASHPELANTNLDSHLTMDEALERVAHPERAIQRTARGNTPVAAPARMESPDADEIPQQLDEWISERSIVEYAIQNAETPPLHMLGDIEWKGKKQRVCMRRLLPQVMDVAKKFIPERIINEVEERKKRLDSELLAKEKELMQWISERRKWVAEPLRTALDSASNEQNVLAGRRFYYGPQRQGRVMDLTLMGIRDRRLLEHLHNDCKCEGVGIIGVSP